MLILVYILTGVAAVFFIAGAVARLRKHEGTVWWRGSMGLLAFAITLLLIEIYFLLGGS